MSYCILKGPILAPAQYKYVSLISDDGSAVDQVAVVRTDTEAQTNVLADLQLGSVGDDQAALDFFASFLKNFPSVPGIKISGTLAAVVASLLNSADLTWTFNAVLTASIHGTPNKAMYRNDTLRKMNLAVIDPQATLVLELTVGK